MILSVSLFDKARECSRTQQQNKVYITDTQEWTTFSMLWDYCFTRSQQLCTPVCGKMAFLKITLFLDLCSLRRNVVDPTSKSLIHRTKNSKLNSRSLQPPLSLSSHKSYLPQPKPHTPTNWLCLKIHQLQTLKRTHNLWLCKLHKHPPCPLIWRSKSNKTNTIIHP